MVVKSLGSLTKEFPLEQIDRTILAVRPGMTDAQLRQFASANTHPAIPGLLAHRFLLVQDGRVVYDRFLSLVASEGIDTPRVRKVMYFVWAVRDPRIARFICEVVAGRDGKWRTSQLTRTANASFFEQFFRPRTAPKVRSNIEYFLAEAGIFDPQTHAIHLELDDGWLGEAMQVAAQHERSPAQRRAMTAAPIEFLIANGVYCLANATPDELRGHAGTVLVEPEPLEDEEIELVTQDTTTSQAWNRPRPTGSGRPSSVAVIDLVARERANAAHWALEKIMRDAAAGLGYDPKQHRRIDMHFATQSRPVLAEMKSCHRGNLHSQIRTGVSQLFEYRFFYKDVVGSDKPTLALVIETPLGPRQKRLLPYLKSLGIALVWKDPDGDRLLSASPIPRSLQGIVHSVT